MLHFILNEQAVSTAVPAGTTLLDYLRYDQHLMGTKIGCREGDCGACTVLVGEAPGPDGGAVRYRSHTSCLTPLGNVRGRHIVTVEGTTPAGGLNAVQQALVEESATQCGFCTPGFVTSLAGFCLSGQAPTAQNAVAAVEGNICRCTGYKSIERAAARVAGLLAGRPAAETPAAFAVRQALLPAYFAAIPERLRQLPQPAAPAYAPAPGSPYVGGGTDLYVQRHHELHGSRPHFAGHGSAAAPVRRLGDDCHLSGTATVTDLAEAAAVHARFPDFRQFFRLISSTPIRNMATLAGNLVNASPIGDFTIIFLALDAHLTLTDDGAQSRRELPLRAFYRGYKQLDRQPGEYITDIRFRLPAAHQRFSFEKVSKRTHLDIASVNSAACFARQADGRLAGGSLSAGGVGPIPLYLAAASATLTDRVVSAALVREVIGVAQAEIRPISDVRGSETYKRLLLGQLIKAHFLRCCPELDAAELL